MALQVKSGVNDPRYYVTAMRLIGQGAEASAARTAARYDALSNLATSLGMVTSAAVQSHFDYKSKLLDTQVAQSQMRYDMAMKERAFALQEESARQSMLLTTLEIQNKMYENAQLREQQKHAEAGKVFEGMVAENLLARSKLMKEIQQSGGMTADHVRELAALDDAQEGIYRFGKENKVSGLVESLNAFTQVDSELQGFTTFADANGARIPIRRAFSGLGKPGFDAKVAGILRSATTLPEELSSALSDLATILETDDATRLADFEMKYAGVIPEADLQYLRRAVEPDGVTPELSKLRRSVLPEYWKVTDPAKYNEYTSLSGFGAGSPGEVVDSIVSSKVGGARWDLRGKEIPGLQAPRPLRTVAHETWGGSRRYNADELYRMTETGEDPDLLMQSSAPARILETLALKGFSSPAALLAPGAAIAAAPTRAIARLTASEDTKESVRSRIEYGLAYDAYRARTPEEMRKILSTYQSYRAKYSDTIQNPESLMVLQRAAGRAGMFPAPAAASLRSVFSQIIPKGLQTVEPQSNILTPGAPVAQTGTIGAATP